MDAVAEGKIKNLPKGSTANKGKSTHSNTTMGHKQVEPAITTE